MRGGGGGGGSYRYLGLKANDPIFNVSKGKQHEKNIADLWLSTDSSLVLGSLFPDSMQRDHKKIQVVSISKMIKLCKAWNILGEHCLCFDLGQETCVSFSVT